MGKHGYHDRLIEKGELGTIGKIREEFEELMDAHEQANPIMELCELADLCGAIEDYTSKRYGISLADVLKMTQATRDAFASGRRK